MASDADIWMITAIIQPFKLDAVVLALQALVDPVGMTVSDCRGFSRRKSPPGKSVSRSENEAVDDVSDFSPKTRLEIALADWETAGRVARVIAEAARTGREGDGKIFISRLADAIRIRTAEVGRNAL